MRLLDFSNYLIHTNDPGKDDFNKRLSEQVEKIKENEKFRRDYAAMNLHDRDLIRITNVKLLLKVQIRTCSAALRFQKNLNLL